MLRLANINALACKQDNRWLKLRVKIFTKVEVFADLPFEGKARIKVNSQGMSISLSISVL